MAWGRQVGDPVSDTACCGAGGSFAGSWPTDSTMWENDQGHTETCMLSGLLDEFQKLLDLWNGLLWHFDCSKCRISGTNCINMWSLSGQWYGICRALNLHTEFNCLLNPHIRLLCTTSWSQNVAEGTDGVQSCLRASRQITRPRHACAECTDTKRTTCHFQYPRGKVQDPGD